MVEGRIKDGDPGTGAGFRHTEGEVRQGPSDGEVAEEQRLARKEWRLWSLAILTILWLTLGILVTPLVRWLGVAALPIENEAGLSVYYLGLVVLVFLLCLYLLRSFRELSRLRSRMLENRRELRGMALSLETFRSLLKVTASIAAERELISLLGLIAREAVDVLGAQHSSLMLLDSSRSVLRTVATGGLEVAGVRRARVRLGEGVAGWVAENRKPRLLQGPVDEKDFLGYETKGRTIVSAACAPLLIQDRILGVLNVNLLEGDRRFDDEALRLLMLYANHAAVAIRNAALLKESREKAKIRSILDGYVSPAVANVLTRNPKGWMNVGEMRDLTVLFADIRGFTQVVHRLGAQQTRLFLNQFFTEMTDILFEHHGTLDKFIGDSVMAFFGAPLPMNAPGVQAVKAARAMLRAFREIQAGWVGKNPALAELSLGVGISTGRLFVGNVGSAKRFDYTVIGQEVNVAKRLCDMAQGGQILLCEATRRTLPAGVPMHDVGQIQFKGLARSVQVFQVIDFG